MPDPVGGGEPSLPDPIVGIDLGTTNSLVAIAAWPPGDPGAQAAAPRIIPDAQGRDLLPSVVRYDVLSGPSASSAPGPVAVAVGYDAKDRATEFPLTTIASVKRLIGRSLDDARSDLPYLSFGVVEGPHRTARALIPSPDGSASAMVSPQEVSAEILRRLKEQASGALGVQVRKAVVTVPAYFDDAQRQATRDAGRLAGLDVVRIVNEPTAAALAYGLGVGPGATSDPRVIAVYDLGGGTFDVSILRLTPPAHLASPARQGDPPLPGAGAFQVLATAGDTHLGGDDFDHALVTLFSSEIRAALAPTVESLDFPPETRRALLTFAELTKIRLSTESQAHIRIDLGLSRDGSPRTYERTITRDEFETLISPLIDRTISSCKRALRDARRGMQDSAETVSAVVLVGGATRTPLVRRRVAEFFGIEPYVALNPDTIVALGAAVQGAIMSGATWNTLLLDVVPLSLGIETVGGAAAKLIIRNSPIPTSAAEMFSTSVDGQTSIKLNIVQGEREMAADCRSLGTFHLSGIPPMPAGIPKIRVTFSLDANAILHVTAVEERSGKVASLQVVPNHGLTRDEVERIESESFQHAREDMARHRIADLIANAALDLNWIQKGMARVGSLLEPGYAHTLSAGILHLQQLLDRARADWRAVDANEFHAAKEALDLASVRLHEISIAESLKGSDA
ncbi:MAG: Hsp70 family protein [Phycisphaerales bacterium]